ncbi:MAG: hypothetical protein ACI9VT_001745 [Psychroserpens sp.]|jgi:hypothetical protein
MLVKRLIDASGRINALKKACRLTGLGLVLRWRLGANTVPLADNDSF